MMNDLGWRDLSRSPRRGVPENQPDRQAQKKPRFKGVQHRDLSRPDRQPQGKARFNHQQQRDLSLSPRREDDRKRLHRQPHTKPRLLVGAVCLLIIVLVAARANTSQTAARPQSRPLAPTLAPSIEKLLAGQVKDEQFSGAALVARDHQVLFSKGYSMANWDHQVPNTPHTRFYLGSTTKQFTAMAILILQQRGKLHVQDSVCSYVPQCPPAWQPVRIHHLLTHTSGIPQLDDSMPLSSPQAWIARYDDVPLAFRPGGRFSYCNICYQILGYVIEQASGEPYSVFLQQAIFGPLQMRDTGFDPNGLTLINHAIGYASWQVKADPVDWVLPPEMSFLRASGLLYSTAEDLYRWDQALYTHVLVSQQLLDEAFTPYAISQFVGSSYGYGWFITGARVPAHRLIWHDGRVDGFRTYIGRYIDDHVTIIILSNLATLDELALARALEQVVFAHK